MKVALSQKQIETIKRHLNEDINSDRYERKVKVSVGCPSGYQYDGMILDDVSTYYDEMRLTFLIEQEHRSWGIKDISIYDIQGYDEIEVELHLYAEGSDEPTIKEVMIPLDWSTLNVESEKSNGVITVGDVLQIIVHVQDGKLVPELIIETYSL
jgi:hypothetical protein